MASLHFAAAPIAQRRLLNSLVNIFDAGVFLTRLQYESNHLAG